MFKILVIQATNNLSDERAEFLINDRLSFMRFLGLGLEDRVPHARTIWLSPREADHSRGDKGAVRAVRCLASGQIVDAKSCSRGGRHERLADIAVPRQ